MTESFLPCCSQAAQGRDLGARDDQTGFPSLPKNPAQGCNYLHLKPEGSLTSQACPQHPEVSGSESHLREQCGTAGTGCDEPGMGERSEGVLAPSGAGGKGNEWELLQPRSCFFWEHGG